MQIEAASARDHIDAAGPQTIRVSSAAWTEYFAEWLPVLLSFSLASNGLDAIQSKSRGA